MVAIDRVVHALRRGVLSAYDLSGQCAMSVKTAQRYLKILHEGKHIRIVEWRRNVPQGPPVPAYAYGAWKDAERPPQRTATELRRARRADPEVRAREAARKRAKTAQDKILNWQYTLADMAMGRLPKHSRIQLSTRK